MARIVGIDLGTTHSLVSIFEAGEPRLIPNSLGQMLTPSVVTVTEDGRALVGAPAREFRFRHPQRSAWCFKRWMGTDHQMMLGPHAFTAPELSSLVLRTLKEDAERYLGHPVREAVVSVPAYFNDHQRLATRQAGTMAGLEVRRIVNEPTAAALAYGFRDPEADKKIIVIDLGGGTFDVTVMEVFEGSLEIISTAGESHLGGEDFTDELVGWAIDQAGHDRERVAAEQPLRLASLRHEGERAKCDLSSGTPATIRWPEADGKFGISGRHFDISDRLFRDLTRPLIERILAPTGRALRDADLKPDDLDEVLLVGGATRMPVLREQIQTLFERTPSTHLNPDEVVALGAAIQAALLEGDEAVEDLVVTDVAPFTLGVAVCRPIGDEYRDGYYLPILHRNTTVPAAREEVVKTIDQDQQGFVLKIYQGEARKVEKNLLLGSLNIEGIPPGPPGQEVRVRFAYDASGILDVDAVIARTGRKFNTVIVHPVSSLSAQEVDKAVEKLRRVVLLPREDAENQMLLAFAERMLEEVAMADREYLDEAIDLYEAALDGLDRESFAVARTHLLALLERLGMSEHGPN